MMASVKEQLSGDLYLPIANALEVSHFPGLRSGMWDHLCRSRSAQNGIPNRCAGLGIEHDFCVAESYVDVYIRVIAEAAVDTLPCTVRVRGL